MVHPNVPAIEVAQESCAGPQDRARHHLLNEQCSLQQKREKSSDCMLTAFRYILSWARTGAMLTPLHDRACHVLFSVTACRFLMLSVAMGHKVQEQSDA